MQKNQIWQFLSAKFYLVCLKKIKNKTTSSFWMLIGFLAES